MGGPSHASSEEDITPTRSGKIRKKREEIDRWRNHTNDNQSEKTKMKQDYNKTDDDPGEESRSDEGFLSSFFFSFSFFLFCTSTILIFNSIIIIIIIF